jgi:hypothetical protein
MASARIRAQHPEQVPEDLAFPVETVQPMSAGTEFQDPIDPIVVHVTDPADLPDGLAKVQSHESGRPVLIQVSTPSLLRQPEFVAIVDEAGSDLFSIDLID